MNLLKFNPELQRSLWVNLTPSRLMVMTITIGLILMLSATKSIVAATSIGLFYIITVIYGAYAASEEIPEEIQEKTWDWQRMSAMPPWQLTIGKLLGSTVYQWYGGIICLFAFLFSALTSGLPFIDVLRTVLILILFGLLMQSTAMLIGMAAREMPIRVRRGLTIFLMLGLGGMFMFMFGTYIFVDFIANKFSATLNQEFKWFFLKMRPINHALILLLFLNFWAIIGLYRSMRIEQYYFNGPEFFIAFLISLPLFLSGYLTNLNDKLTFSIFFMILFILMASLCFNLTIITGLLDKMEIMNLRRFFNNISQKNFEKAGYDLPLWAISYVIQIISSILGLLFFLIASKDEILKPNQVIQVFYFLLTVNLFSLRDLGIMMYNNFTQGKRAVGFSILYLFLLYMIIPGIIAANGGEDLLPAFYPFPTNDDSGHEASLVNVLIPLIECAIIFLIVRGVWLKKSNMILASIKN